MSDVTEQTAPVDADRVVILCARCKRTVRAALTRPMNRAEPTGKRQCRGLMTRTCDALAAAYGRADAEREMVEEDAE